jgi:hypothetical protein
MAFMNPNGEQSAPSHELKHEAAELPKSVYFEVNNKVAGLPRCSDMLHILSVRSAWAIIEKAVADTSTVERHLAGGHLFHGFIT